MFILRLMGNRGRMRGLLIALAILLLSALTFILIQSRNAISLRLALLSAGLSASENCDGTVNLWDVSSPWSLAMLFILPPRQKGAVSTDWLVLTSAGYYDGSAEARRFVRWRVGSKLFPAEACERTFHRPDLVQKALQGERLPPPGF